MAARGRTAASAAGVPVSASRRSGTSPAARTSRRAFGSFTFTGLYEEGYFPTDPVSDPATYSGPFTYYRTLELVFKAANGNRLALAASSSSSTAPSTTLANGGTVGGTWTVDQARSTGRYSRFSGSGTYTLSGTVQGTYESFSLALSGSLTFS